jgi:hypothetical protein
VIGIDVAAKHPNMLGFVENVPSLKWLHHYSAEPMLPCPTFDAICIEP